MKSNNQNNLKYTINILLVFVFILTFSNCENNKSIDRKVEKKPLLLADREAPLGWVYLSIYEDSSFVFTSTGLRSTSKKEYHGKVKITNDSLFFNYYDSVPKAGKTAVYNERVVGYIDGVYPERLIISLTKLSKVNHNQEIEKALNLVKNQKKVKSLIREIDSLSKGKRQVTFIPTIDDSIKNIFLIKVGENNGFSVVTYYNFLIDANTMTIINLQENLKDKNKKRDIISVSFNHR